MANSRTPYEIMDQLPAVIFEYTLAPNGWRGFTYVSPRCEKILGIDREILLNEERNVKEFVHPEDWESYQLSTEKSIAEGSEWKWEGRICNSNSIKWIGTSAAPNRHADGSISWMGIMTDISERKQIEEWKHEAEVSYRNLLEQLPLGVGVHKDGKFVYLNEYAVRMLNAHHISDLIGRSVLDFVHPADLEKVKTRLRNSNARLSQGIVEERFLTIDGKTIHVEASSHPVNYEGEPAIQVIVKDITDIKLVEESFRKTDTLFTQLFQNAPMAIVMLSDRGTVVRANKGFEEMFRFAEQELVGKELNQFIVPEGLESEGNDLNTLISSNRVIRIETQRLQKDGKLLSVILYGMPVHLDEATLGIFGLYVDITEQKRIEEELKVRNTELDNFVYKVSHDLRAPLSSILGLVNLANLPGNDDNLKEYIPLVGQKVKQLDHFISDVLSHSKNIKLDVHTELIDLKKIIEQTFTDLNYLNGVDEIGKKISVSGADFYNDPWRIGEIFRNLISNAIKYRKLNGSGSFVEIASHCTNQSVEIVFKDNGIGIPLESQSRIFEMFYRASGQSDGSGLGLYIVKKAVEKLGGMITVKSELEVGTTFIIVLPNLTRMK